MTDHTRREQAFERVARWREEHRIPGLSVAISHGRDVTARGFGHRMLDPPCEATSDTRYAVGSVGKPITALATLIATDEHGVTLDSAVVEYLPVFARVPGDPITVQQLLSHTSGMPDDDLAMVASDLERWEGVSEMVAEVAPERLTGLSSWIYYNTGYVALARLIEVLTGASFASYVRDELFEPLDMDASRYGPNTVDGARGNLMQAYELSDGVHREVELQFPPVLAGAGGLVAPVTDLAQFLRLQTRQESPVPPEKLRRLRRPVTTRRRLVDGTQFRYGSGWELDPFGDDILVGHGGNTGSSGGYIGYLQEAGIGVALAWNMRPPTDPRAIATELLAILLDEPLSQLDPTTRLERQIEAFEGSYESIGGAHTASLAWEPPAVRFEISNPDGTFENKLRLASIEDETYRFIGENGLEETPTMDLLTGQGATRVRYDQLLFRPAPVDRPEGR